MTARQVEYMAQRKDQRNPTAANLECYDRALELSAFTMRMCKPKEKNQNGRHVIKRQLPVANKLMETILEIGSDILEANQYYVGANSSAETLAKHYRERIRLQETALSMTFRAEHIFATLDEDRPFEDSTLSCFMGLLTETRRLIVAWHSSDVRRCSEIPGGKGGEG